MSDIASELRDAIGSSSHAIGEATMRFPGAINGLGSRVNTAKQAAMSGDYVAAFDELSGLVRDLQDVIQIGVREGGLSLTGYSKVTVKAKDLRVAILGISNDLADLDES